MTNAQETLLQMVISLLDGKKYVSLRDILTTMNAADIATLFEDLEEERIPLLFRLLPKELAADTFVEMPPESQELLIRGFSDNELKEVLGELYLDDAVDIVEEMPANVVSRILAQADPEMRTSINELLRYPEDSAGSIMTTEYVSLRPAMLVSDAIKHIRRTGVDKETINICYVAKNHILVGMVSIRMLLLSDEDAKIEDIMEENVISVTTLMDKEEVAQMFSKYDFAAMPVVDKENRIVGIVTFDDAMDVMEDEATEDIQKMAAILPNDKPYLRTSVFETWKSRMPWLLLLMISATFTGMIISSFETALSSFVALTAFIPMLMDTGGNCGSQASVTVIRALSLKEVELRDVFRVVWKEFRVAFFCAVSLAVVNFAKIMLVDGMLFHNAAITPLVATVVCLTLVFTVCCAKVVGCTLPMLASRIGFDPAVMASPFITTIVDAISLLIYFQIAKLLLHI